MGPLDEYISTAKKVGRRQRRWPPILPSIWRWRQIYCRSTEKSFEAANPDIKIQWVRDSTGVITAKLLAEKDNPQADE